ncbi:Uncharacterized conserved protein YutE, UPF0331/DUF86 family [Modestobacter sp. DSM 44400]|uniref:type VII toxin-antitoxin system HepT family RNase toxin n=1 Tax=Modestobacter sp. DSM 44400 TaxID=1550230 RepID=UPI000898AF01|nr:DUF86 domain-containing protein [Modestobacter sp. DSM 44400]SDY44344.1 Uncharacterized conserved protein YutE, UPF0331/DUF86 family [Modestobacter sp. DSM 44400]
MVDPERLTRVLTRVRRDAARIRTIASTHDLASDETALDAVKYGFVTAIEGCVRAAAHVGSSEGLGVPDTNAQTIALLAEHGIVPAAAAAPVARAVGFGNLLVHEYADVDDDVVRANVALLPDLDAFVAAVAGWAVGQG